MDPKIETIVHAAVCAAFALRGLKTEYPYVHLGCGHSPETVAAVAARLGGTMVETTHPATAAFPAQVIWAARDCFIDGVHIEIQGSRLAAEAEIVAILNSKAA